MRPDPIIVVKYLLQCRALLVYFKTRIKKEKCVYRAENLPLTCDHDNENA